MRTSKTIKDPTFNIYRRGGSVEKAMESKGDGKAKEELMQLAKDEKDILFDVESEITDILLDNYNKEKKPGQSFLDWLGTKDREYLIKIPLGLKEGGEVIDFLSYLKQKEKPRIKKIDLAQGDFEKTVAGLSSADKDLIKDLLRRSGIRVSD